MAIDKFRKINITLNKANQRVLETQIAKVGDVNGRELVVRITNNGVIEDQTGTSLKLNWQHENGKQGSTNFNVVDIKTGLFSVYYPKEMLYKGKVNASIEITSNGQITNSMNFKIIVQADVFDGEAGTVDGVFITLAEVNKKLDDREKEYVELKSRQTSVETQFNTIKQELTDKDVISAPEIIGARIDTRGVTSETLKERLDNQQYYANVKSYGAYGDGITDDTEAIQNALNEAASNGGGTVYVPSGKYITSKALRVKSGVVLVGEGKSSWIHNDREIGFERCVVITGNIGDITSKTSIYDNPQHAIENVSYKTNVITVKTGIENYAVGDVIFILSNEKWSDTFPDSVVPKYQDMAKIIEISGNQIKLDHGVNDDFIDPTICKLGVSKGYDGEIAWMAENAKVEKLRLTHNMGQISGWYAIFAYGYKCEFKDLYMDKTSTVIGSNGLGYSTLENIDGNYDAGTLDFADMQISNVYKKLKLSRVGVNRNVNILGVSCHDGADNIFEDCELDLGGQGGLGGLYNHRLTVRNTKVLNAGPNSLNSVVYGCFGEGFYCDNVSINGGKRHGIYVPGEKSTVINSNIIGMDYQDLGMGITLRATVKNSIIKGNKIGGTIKSQRDTIFQGTAFDKTNIFSENITYNTQNHVNDNGFISTTDNSPKVLKKYTVKNNLYGKDKTFKIIASGSRSGVNGTKSVELKIGETLITNIPYASGDSERWYIEASLIMANYQQGGRIYYKTMKNTNLIDQGVKSIVGLTSDVDISVVGLANVSGDSINADLFNVEVIS